MAIHYWTLELRKSCIFLTLLSQSFAELHAALYETITILYRPLWNPILNSGDTFIWNLEGNDRNTAFTSTQKLLTYVVKQNQWNAASQNIVDVRMSMQRTLHNVLLRSIRMMNNTVVPAAGRKCIITGRGCKIQYEHDYVVIGKNLSAAFLNMN